MSTPPGQLPILDEVGAELNRLFEAEERRQPSLRRGFQSRRGRGWLRARVLLPLAAVLVASGATAATVTLSGGSKPIHAGKFTTCPPGDNYVASTTSGLVFPANYPTNRGTGLTSRSVVRCFSRLQQAIDAGYKVAGVPHGFTQVAGIYFAKSDAYVRATCGRAQRAIESPVFCPQVLPAPWGDRSDPGNESATANCPSTACSEPLLSVNGTFSASPQDYANGSELGTAAIWAISTAQQSEPAAAGLTGCPSPRLRSPTRFRGHPAGWYTCHDPQAVTPDTAFQWTIGQEHYGIELGGDGPISRELTQYIAAHLVELQPRS